MAHKLVAVQVAGEEIELTIADTLIKRKRGKNESNPEDEQEA